MRTLFDAQCTDSLAAFDERMDVEISRVCDQVIETFGAEPL